MYAIVVWNFCHDEPPRSGLGGRIYAYKNVYTEDNIEDAQRIFNQKSVKDGTAKTVNLYELKLIDSSVEAQVQ
jgi:hypothetical protein